MNSPQKNSDEDVVELIVGGDVDAYEEIINRYEAKLRRYATFLLRDPATASDVVQDTFIKAYQNLQGFNLKYKFSSWIYRIAHNEAMNAIKKSKHTAVDIDDLADLGYEPKTHEIIDQDILKEHVHGCLQKLEPKYREVIQLIYFENMKYEEASDVLHVPTSTVGVWLSRAKNQLKEFCRQKGVKP